ncbi:OST-HTH/LOTUS domain-containing protein [Fibrobacter succinogenes]|uniref:OST-HTH/LOTUS domain-containing protein n=2 Tax=Fibrobacter TaxID=832 RepID=UPI0026E988B8|nr:OST-HTH/LOTUS domain-containing protein [Fibrobacter succinogenes]
MNAIRTAIKEEAEEAGWAVASKVSQQINRIISLSPKNFGYSKWQSLIRATDYFEESKNSKGQLVFRIKNK